MGKKAIKIWFWVVTLLFVAFMLFSGVSELIGTQSGVELFTSLGYPLYLNYILGVAKVLGCIALVIPSFRVLKEWAYAGFTFDIVGASASFLLGGFGAGNALFTLVFLVPLVISYVLWKKMRK